MGIGLGVSALLGGATRGRALLFNPYETAAGAWAAPTDDLARLNMSTSLKELNPVVAVRAAPLFTKYVDKANRLHININDRN
jgi:hypothetical protein